MLPKLTKAEGELPKETLREMCKCALADALSTSASVGIVLSPREFQRVVLTKIGEETLADQLDDQNQVFAQTEGHNDEIEVHPDVSVDELREQLLPFAAERSVAGPLLEKRASIVRACEVQQRPDLEPVSSPFLTKVAELYNGYRRALVKKANVIEQVLASDPQLLPLVAGESMVQAFAGGIEKTASASVLGPESLAYLRGAHYEEEFGGIP